MSVGRIHHFHIAHEEYSNEIMVKFNRKVREIKDVISQAKYGSEGLACVAGGIVWVRD